MKKLMHILVILMLFTLAGCYSCQSWHHAWGKPRDAYPEDKVFWSKDCKPMTAAPAKPSPEPVKPPKPAVRSECGVSSAVGHYPCEGCTVARLERNMPAEVAMNTRFDYTIKVINPTDDMLDDVVVTEKLADNFKLADTDPKARMDGGKLTFEIGALDPGRSRLITVSGMATSTDCLKSCATVSYVIPTCASVKVVKPALKLVKTAPASVLLCEPIPVKFVVTNAGTGSTGNVKIEDVLPAGLRTIDGKGVISIDAGTLAAGQSREFSATIKANKTGRYVNKAVASSAMGLEAEDSTTTEVRQPVLAITKNGPEKRYLGRPVEFEITVTNKGDAAATETVIRDTVPSGTKFVSASAGGSLSQNAVVWNMGTLQPGASRKVTVTYAPAAAGIVNNTASASAVCAEAVTASARTSVSGIPAVLLEVIDVSDPIELGQNETYVITVTNQGTAAATNVAIKCVLEDSMRYVSASGATAGSAAADTVTFRPLGSLAPKAKATWRVVVKAVKAGDVRFKVIMNADQVERDVQETESTHFYE